jgi:hypothetical protein
MSHTANNSITRIHNPSQQEFLNLWKQGQAFIISGVANQWDAYKKWSNEYLTNHCGSNLVPVEAYNESFFKDYNYARSDSYKITQMEFKDYVEVCNGKNQNENTSYYMAQVDFNKYFTEIHQDVKNPQFFTKKPKVVYLFFGFSKKKSTSTTYLHFDDVHNIFAQIRGRKKFILFPPKNYLSFYPPLEDNRYSPTFSKVNPAKEDLKSYPKFPWQDKIEIILEPGEILYIPPLWWHHVTALEENISLTFWYSPSIKDLIVQKGLLSTLLQIAPSVIPSQVRKKFKKQVN